MYTEQAFSSAAEANQQLTVLPNASKHWFESGIVLVCNLVHSSDVYTFILVLRIGLIYFSFMGRQDKDTDCIFVYCIFPHLQASAQL